MNTNPITPTLLMLFAKLHKALFILLAVVSFTVKAQDEPPLAVYRVIQETMLGEDVSEDAVKDGTVIMFFEQDGELCMSRVRAFKKEEIWGALRELRIMDARGGTEGEPWMLILECKWKMLGVDYDAHLDTTIMITGNTDEALPDMLMTNSMRGDELATYRANFMKTSEAWQKIISEWRTSYVSD